MTELEHVACAICGGTTTHPFCRKFEQTIVTCCACGLIFVNPRMTARETALRYSESYFWSEYLPAVAPPDGVDVNQFLRDRYGATFDLLPHLNTRAALLEVGAGAGFLLKAGELFGWRACGVEYSQTAATYAHQRQALPIVRASAMQLPFRSGSFEAALMFDVIEHLHNPLEALAEVRRCLRIGGTLILTTPNLNALSRTVLGSDWAVLSPSEHLYYFTEETLRQLLSKAGFRSVRFTRRYRAWGPLETMNARYTHAPHAQRARLYDSAVKSAGKAFYRLVQTFGWADAVLAVARVDRASV